MSLLGVPLLAASAPETDEDPRAIVEGYLAEDPESSPEAPVLVHEDHELPWKRVICELKEKVFRCELPAHIRDFRVDFPGAAPLYFWDQDLEPGQTHDLGRLHPRPGASLMGWVAGQELSAGVEIEVEMVPARAAVSADPSEVRRHGLTARQVKANAEGFFQLMGIAPGSYRLSAKAGESWSSEVMVSVEQREVRLDSPLMLEPPARAEIYLDPPVDPWGEPWVVTLSTPVAGGVSRQVHQAPGDSTGLWQHVGLRPGEYGVQISDSRGSQWLTRDVVLDAQSKSQFFTIDVIPIRGSLSLGGEALESKIAFGGWNGVRAIFLSTNEEGRFEGYLPFEGEWGVEIRLEGGQGRQTIEQVAVFLRDGKTVVDLELELPDTHLRGRVVRKGESARALILGLRKGSNEERGRKELTLQTDESGTFEVRGISPGEFRIHAYDAETASEWHVVDLREGVKHPEVVLELKRRKKIEGILQDSVGPVAGARVLAYPDHGLTTGGETQVDGTFQLKFQREALQADLIVLPPRGGLFFARVGLREDEALRLVSSSESGDLVLLDPTQNGVLFRGAVGFPMSRILSIMAQHGRFESHPRQGLLLQGFAAGRWTLCPESTLSQDCQQIQLLPGTESELWLPEPKSDEGKFK